MIKGRQVTPCVGVGLSNLRFDFDKKNVLIKINDHIIKHHLKVVSKS